tara:strand:+ start:516 stop:779 length:264 start_codon:yes stop_codon:yes gene_type:complete
MFGTFWKKLEPQPEPEEAVKDLEWFSEPGVTGWFSVHGEDIYYATYDVEAKLLRVAMDEDFINCTNIITGVRSVLCRNPDQIKMREG